MEELQANCAKTMILRTRMQAARELKKAMESGNAKVLKEALDKAKLHKVSQEAWENRCSRVSFTCSYFVSMIG